jgi:hypothetical protein
MKLYFNHDGDYLFPTPTGVLRISIVIRHNGRHLWAYGEGENDENTHWSELPNKFYSNEWNSGFSELQLCRWFLSELFGNKKPKLEDRVVRNIYGRPIMFQPKGRR